MADTTIKPDPEGAVASPRFMEDDDIYEDAGDMAINEEPGFQKLWLGRVPKYVWDAWEGLGEDLDEEIQIGTIRNCRERMPDGSIKDSYSMLLNSNLAQHQTVPKEYNLDITNQNVKNTFIFSEQDLPGFKSKSRQKFALETANMPARLTRGKIEKSANKQPWDPNKKFQPQFRKAIPKRTTLAGRVVHELSCIAVQNEESDRLLAIRTLEAMKPKVGTKFLNEDIDMGHGFIQPGTIKASDAFNSFIKTKNQTTGGKPQLTKAARMPQNELLDRIFDCFRRYNYWSMKALRAELQQPEAYLRETLEKIAFLAKTGRFATQWSLKPENKLNNYEGAGDAIAPGDDTDLGDDDEDDDEDVKFEDV
ncbi:hypothetical protein EYC80_004739 [Monilinia laxa]|uniref:Transcription initiation factor IIF subunit beta n=1 Tax=Monilinia laxa TaxID=61186 RepID=A0A5N6KJA9_MONLA|nr:hypothetical protein EYC80_004739 [Monilinia laxa]